MKELIKRLVKGVPFVGDAVMRAYWSILARTRAPQDFPGSATYWEKRYSEGGDSGVGSYGFFAEFKADFLNTFVAEHGVQTVIEFGCGDGNQLGLARYPQYVGIDISSTAIARCKELYGSDISKSFALLAEYDQSQADLALSLDVIYHLVEDSVFENYMRQLFSASRKFVIVYSSNSEDNRGYEGTHVRHREFTRWIRGNLGDWKFVTRVPNRHPYRGDYRTGSFADFFVFQKS